MRGGRDPTATILKLPKVTEMSGAKMSDNGHCGCVVALVDVVALVATS